MTEWQQLLTSHNCIHCGARISSYYLIRWHSLPLVSFFSEILSKRSLHSDISWKIISAKVTPKEEVVPSQGFHSRCFTHWGISVRLPIIFCPIRKYLSAKKLDFASTRIGTQPLGEFPSSQHPVHPMNQVFHFSSQNSHVNVVHYGWKFMFVHLVIRLILTKKGFFAYISSTKGPTERGQKMQDSIKCK